MRKLDILIPTYNEKEDIIKPLLDSIAIQQNVDLINDVGVIICCDGGSFAPSDELINNYPFTIEFYKCDHHGVSATRNSCLDKSKAEYVMFCDVDDMFCNVCGLWVVFREMESGFDSMVSAFVEETRVEDEVVYVNHDMDSTFVHGKIHRRKYLKNKKIRFHDNLTIHEDSYFNILCQNLSKNVKYCPTPFYLWKWRDESVCRHDPKYILKTYRNMLDSNDALVDEFIKRGVTDKAMYFTAFMIFDAYYTMNKNEWIAQENKDYRDNTERRFSDYYKKHKNMWDAISQNDKMAISNGVRSRSVMEGMGMESITIDAWLEHIMNL